MVRWLFGLLILIPTLGQAALTARFERDTLYLNESVRLILETDSLFRGAVELGTVEKYFEIINQTTSQNISIVNGQQSMVQRYIIELSPLSAGSFTIGPITLGNELTEPMRVTVLPERTVASSDDELFIESEVDSDSVYVQQQVLLTVRLFLGTGLLDGSLADPAPESTRVERVGEDRRYQVQRDGRNLSVYERRYALYPQKSGELEIPPIRFQGIADDQRGSNQLFGSMFNQGRRVSASGSRISITVKPPPNAFSGSNWLPAKALQLDELGDVETETAVGQPVTRKIQIQAAGLTAEQLPDVEFGAVDGARFYPDQAVRDTVAAEGGMVGILQSSAAIVGSAAGEVTLPAIDVAWWNVETDQEEIARLPARTIRFIGETVARESRSIDDTTSDPVANAEDPQTSSGPMPKPGVAHWWRWLAIALIALWPLTVIVLTMLGNRTRRIAPVAQPDDVKQTIAGWRGELESACRAGDQRAARQALVGWNRAVNGPAANLGSLMRQIVGTDLGQEIKRLERILYDPHYQSPPWRGGDLWRAFEKYAATSRKTAAHAGPLEPLYPRSVEAS